MQPLQYHLRDPAAKDNSMTHAGAVPSNLDAAITMRSAETELRNGFGNCSSKTGSRRQTEKKTILKHFSKGILKGKLIAPKFRKSTDKSLSQPSCSHSNTFMCPCLFSADNATRKNIRKKKHLFLHRLTFSYIFLCLQAPLVCLVVIKLRSVRGIARYPALDASHGCSSADAALGQEPLRRMGMWSKWLSDVICICAYCASECFRNHQKSKQHKIT